MVAATKVTCRRKGREEEEEGGMFEAERGDQWVRPHTRGTVYLAVLLPKDEEESVKELNELGEPIPPQCFGNLQGRGWGGL